MNKDFFSETQIVDHAGPIPTCRRIARFDGLGLGAIEEADAHDNEGSYG
jgi:hypothetical protein